MAFQFKQHLAAQIQIPASARAIRIVIKLHVHLLKSAALGLGQAHLQEHIATRAFIARYVRDITRGLTGGCGWYHITATARSRAAMNSLEFPDCGPYTPFRW